MKPAPGTLPAAPEEAEMAKYDPDQTREQLLTAAFDEVYQSGISAASLDGILGRAGVTKGALYHHFGSKKELCRSLIAEVILPRVAECWIAPLRGQDDPVAVIGGIVREKARKIEPDQLRNGCPLNNLSQEVSALDDELRAELDRIYSAWIGGLRDALARGQGAGTVRRDVDPERIARFVVAAAEGAFGLGKSTQSAAAMRDALEALADYVDTLAPAS